MPFSCLKQIFKKHAGDAANKYLGEDAKKAVEGAVEQGFDQINDETVASLMTSFTGSQQSGITNLFSTLSGDPQAIEKLSTDKGLDPSLISGITSMLSSGGGGGGGGSGGGTGFDIGNLLQVVSSLTKGSSGGGGLDGFMGLLGGGDSGGQGSSNNVLKIIAGLAVSFFSMQMNKNKSLQQWDAAGASPGKDKDNFMNWAMMMLKDLIFPGKKGKEMIDADPSDKPTGTKDNVKGWFDGHPEIGKMQKDVFDDIFDTTDDDDVDRLVDDPSPLVPMPKGFEPDCSMLDQASILFLNTNLLLDLRKEWRFLYSSKTTETNSFGDFVGLVQLKGPTLILIKDENDNVFGICTSTSWIPTEGGWSGNGDTFVFAIKPKMAVFHATGKDDNIMFMSVETGLGVGGRIGHFGLSINADLKSGNYHDDIDTFDLPALLSEDFQISHLEVWGLGPDTNPAKERQKVAIRKPNTQIKDTRPVDMDDIMGQIC